jgi:mannose/fructose/N-acetylgalactosamine-specific phosphotransferase system component IIB
MTILGKDTSNEVNERYVEENNYINNLLKDLFPKMGFMDKSIMKNLKKIDKIIENNSENTLLLQNELQELIDITFENGNILFENEKVSEMKKLDNSDMLQQEIDNLKNDIQKLKELKGLQGE